MTDNEGDNMVRSVTPSGGGVVVAWRDASVVTFYPRGVLVLVDSEGPTS